MWGYLKAKSCRNSRVVSYKTCFFQNNEAVDEEIPNISFNLLEHFNKTRKILKNCLF